MLGNSWYIEEKLGTQITVDWHMAKVENPAIGSKTHHFTDLSALRIYCENPWFVLCIIYTKLHQGDCIIVALELRRSIKRYI